MRGIVVAGTHSGCGKTTVTLGLLAALKKKGLTIQAFKAGPDFIDIGIHKLITKRASRNLDIWMCGKDYVRNCFITHSRTADISVVEGVMGLYDGNFSTAVLAHTLDLPVILVVDAYGMAESAGAVVAGFRDWGSGISQKNTNPQTLTPNPFICGIIFNRVGSENHYKRLKDSIKGIPVFGYLPRDSSFEIPHRHLGLMVAEENPITAENIDRLADTVLQNIDVEKVLRSAECGMRKDYEPEIPNSNLVTRNSSPVTIAVAYDKAFCFYYEDNLDLLRAAGAEIVTFSPISDSSILDNADAIYIGGGYPELYAAELSENTLMLKAIHAWADSGKPIYAECGGLIYLSKDILDLDGILHKMTGVFPFETVMNKKRTRLGYRELMVKEDCILGKKEETFKGHEYHYSEIKSSPQPAMVYSVRDGQGKDIGIEGYRIKNTLASYIHIHFGSSRDAAKCFVDFAGKTSA